MKYTMQFNNLFGFGFLIGSFLLLSNIAIAVEPGEQVVAPPPAVADVAAPIEIPADHAVNEQVKPLLTSLHRDALFQKIYEARLAKVTEIEAVSKKNIAQANAEAKKASSNVDSSVGAVNSINSGPAQVVAPVTSPSQDKPRPVKVDNSNFDDARVVMIVGETSASITVGGPTKDFLVGEEKGGIKLQSINSSAQEVTIKNVKSGKVKNISIDSTSKYPSKNFEPVKSAEEKK